MESEKKSEGVREDAFRLIKYVNTWKKLGILMVFVVFCGISYASWENRRELSVWLISVYGTPKIDNEAIEPEVTKLLADVGGKSVTVWAINLHQNKRTAIYFRVGERRLNDLEGTGDLALRPYSDHSANIIKTITDKTLCAPLIANTAIGEAARKAGITYVCYAAIPPSHGTMIGLLVVGFAEPPKNEDYVKLRMIAAAQRIIE